MRKLSATLLLALLLILALSPLAVAYDGTTGSIVRIFGNIVIESDQIVHGDVVTIFGNIEVHGEVYGSVVTVIGDTKVTSTGRVWEDAVTVIGNLVADGTVSGSKVNVLGNGGDFRFPSIRFGNFFRQALHFRFNLFRELGGLAFAVLLATIIVALFPVPVERVKASIEGNPGKMVLVGLLAWIVIIPSIFIVALTIIGIPLALLMGAAVWVAGKLGTAGLVLIIGRALLKNTESSPAVAALGALLLGAVTILPIVGGLVGLAVSLVTIGAVTVTRFGTRDEVKTV